MSRQKPWKFVLLGVVGVVAVAAYHLLSRPSLDRYEAIELGAAPPGPDLRVTFLGVSTLLFRDATAAVLVDGFFTRPAALQTWRGTIGPDSDRITAGLALGGIHELDAVVTAHSHYDHAMDAPEVAKRTGAMLVGSPSTANIAKGWGLDDAHVHVVHGVDTLRFGDLKVTLVPSMHFPHGIAMGEITAPLVPPAAATDYKEGGSFSILIERAGRSVLVQSSAGYVTGALAGRHADVVYLGVGLLGEKDGDYREAYWRQVVSAVGARRVVPIHWDDFTRALDEPLLPIVHALDDLDVSMSFVMARAATEHVEVRWPVLGVAADPFAGL
ncbi:MAG TPA: MBL fold metallo-hydrolase [Candidatus Binatia bacterium]|jgi:L-ascorbate metabolism protein UlaG (beta-lactamase superfamily)